MATTTENLGMTLPDTTDPVDVTVLNADFSAIDTFAGTQAGRTASLINAGAKNILKNTATTQTLSAVTFTVNADGSVTVNGTATGSTGLRVVGVQGSGAYADATPIPRGNYVVYPSNTGNPRIRWGIGITTASDATRDVTYIYDTPVRFEVTNDTTRYDFTLAVTNGEECNGETLYPMICTADDYAASPAYVPYVPTMLELYQMIQTLQTGGTT